MPDFSKRSEGIEIMDDLQCSGEVVDQTLRELEVINTWLGGNQVTINGLAKLLKDSDPSKEITILDVGCGGGDILRLIDAWAKRKNKKVKLVGIDANPNIIAFAKNNLNDLPHVQFESIDIFSSEFQSITCDVVIGTLFFHHFSQHQLSLFFSGLKKQVRIGIVINDIHRHALAYYSIKILTSLFSKSAMVKFDAPLSVLRAFTKSELIEILTKAKMRNFSIHWKWAFRWQVVMTV
ncbi:MAG TPA: methyltransferase domain-containing protein [Chryseolinea sp.]|nr:methyltransferase domain-containing protein [Chryseolinea sp.]HPH45567.1 methyltransferase domain-containing protein [Chryseolinea sp.]HPM29001.1 methyltransferase domain-containing protein [Chryseolinea sp.]